MIINLHNETKHAPPRRNYLTKRQTWLIEGARIAPIEPFDSIPLPLQRAIRLVSDGRLELKLSEKSRPKKAL